MLRYATMPIPSNSKNANVKPAAIFLPNVHMSSLLGDATLVATPFNEFHHVGDAHDRTNQIRGTHYVLDVGARGVPLVSGVQLCRRNPQVAFEITEGQANWLFGTAQNKPATLARLPAVTEEHRQAAHGNEPAAYPSSPQ